MIYSDIRRLVLSHIDRYSTSGTPIPSAYSLQQDDENRVPLFVNAGLLAVRAKTNRKRIFTPIAGEVLGHWRRYALPQDCRSVVSGGVWQLTAGEYRRCHDFCLQGGRYILLPPGDGYSVEYRAKPLLLPPDPKANYDLQEDEEEIYAAALYAASALVRRADEFACSALYREFLALTDAMIPAPAAEAAVVSDPYGGEA